MPFRRAPQQKSEVPAAEPAAPPIAQPLPTPQVLVLALMATGVMFLFYLYCALALGVIAAIIVAESALAIVTSYQPGLAAYFVAPAKAQARLALLILRSLNLRSGVEYQMTLRREDAPRLYDLVETFAKRIGVQAPSEIVLESNRSAWVQLKGYRKGKGRARLGLGFDLLAVFSVAEIEGVIAHELAHARLVQRGYNGWLFKGVARINRFAAALDSVEEAYKKHNRKFYTASTLGKIAHRLGKTGNHLVAALSRQDEFAADRVAAEVVGASIYRDALLHVHTIDYGQRRPDWRDRVLQVERDEGYAAWVRSRLTPTSEEERLNLEERALHDTKRNELDTHPILADRLAALPPRGAEPMVASEEPAIDLLDAPDVLGSRLINELDRRANEEERQDSERLRAWIRKQGKGKHRRFEHGLGQNLILGGAVCWGLVVVIGSMFWSDPAAWIPLGVLAGLGCIGWGGALALWMRTRFPSRPALPVPSLSQWEDSLEKRDALDLADGWRVPIAAKLRAQLPSNAKTRAAKSRFWLERCYEALGRCDYQSAEVATRLCFETDQRRPEALLCYGLGGVYFNRNGAMTTLNNLIGEYGIGTTMSWAMAWAHCLDRQWDYAEMYLLDAVARRQDEATLWSLLGLCQWRCGKMREAAQSVRHALGMEPNEVRHRVLLSRILLATGRPRTALEELAVVEHDAGTDFDVMLGFATAVILLGRWDEATDRAQSLEAAHPGAKAFLRLGDAYLDADQEIARDQARCCFQKALEIGFYPSAHVGLARVASVEKDNVTARRHLLAALDVMRERPDDAAHPMSLLRPIFNGLISTGDEKAECKAWRAKIDLGDSPAPAQSVSLLVCHTSFDAAKDYVRDIYGAMHPGQELPPERVHWGEVKPADQPDEPIVPGIYRSQLDRGE